MSRLLALGYGLGCYVCFLGTFLYAIGFLANRWVPKTIDSGPAGSIGEAIAVNGLLLLLFALQHTPYVSASCQHGVVRNQCSAVTGTPTTDN